MKTITFSANANRYEGTGHLKRLVDIASKFNRSEFFLLHLGDCEVKWLHPQVSSMFLSTVFDNLLESDLLIIDSYNPQFIESVITKISPRSIIQVADRFTPIFHQSKILWLDPFMPPSHLSPYLLSSHSLFPTQVIEREIKQVQIAKNVLLMTGGLAQDHVTSAILKILVSLKLDDIEYHILGPSPYGFEIPNNFKFYEIGSNLDHLIRLCDTAISSCGSSIWNLISNGLILGFYKFVQNQKSNYEFLQENLLGINLQNSNDHFVRERFVSLFTDPSLRGLVQSNGMKKIPREGLCEIYDCILETL